MNSAARYYHFPASGFLLELCPGCVLYACLETGLVLYSETPAIVQQWERMETEKNRVSAVVFRIHFKNLVGNGDLSAT